MATTPIFIGVGGTGQMVLAAYLRLARMAGFTPAPFFIVDSDTEGRLGGSLVRLRSEVDEVVGGNPPAERWMIDPFPTADAERKTFGGLFGNLAGERRELFECLFSEETEKTQIRTGMYGRPAIGATCIRYKLLQEDDDLMELKNSLRGGEKHIVLVGSCFGGTGSGGVPMLASELAKLRDEGYKLRVDAVVFLPWFRLVLPEGDLDPHNKELHDRLNREFEPNAAAGIHYFKRQLKEHVDTLVLLGVPDRAQVERESSEKDQEEEPHILNLLAATLIQNHFQGALEPPRGVTGYWFEEDEGLHPRSLLVHRAASSAPLSLAQVIHRAYLRSQWLGLLSTLFANYSKLPRSHRPVFLQAALHQLQGTTLNEAKVIAAIAERLSKLQKRAEEHMDWVRRMRGKGNSKLFSFPEGAERIQNDLYDRMVETPLAAVGTWCDDREVAASFQRKDLQTLEGFCDKFSNRFLDHLTETLNL